MIWDTIQIFSYFIVLPIVNPATESAMLENLLPYTSYQLVIRTTNTSKSFLQTDTIYFSTSGKITLLKKNIQQYFSVVTAFSGGAFLGGQDFKNDEILLVFFILGLWGVVLSIFFQRWGKNFHARINIHDFGHSGKLRSLLPYQPVYSKEMVEKIEMIKTEKKMRSNRTSFSFFPVDCGCNVKVITSNACMWLTNLMICKHS